MYERRTSRFSRSMAYDVKSFLKPTLLSMPVFIIAVLIAFVAHRYFWGAATGGAGVIVWLKIQSMFAKDPKWLEDMISNLFEPQILEP